MSIAFKPEETFRGDYSYRNSDAAILRFPFPFPEDKYMYSVNIEPHVRSGPSDVFLRPFDVDEHYIAECRDRAITLERDPGRCQVLPHMMLAQWDTLELLMENLSADYPEHFSLTKEGDDFGSRWTWTNRPLGIEQSFIFGDAATLPCEPFEYITRQAQGDFAICDQRDDNLYMDAGMVTSQADWSLEFDVGMSFMEWHGPVPLAHQTGVFERALKYLLMLRLGQPVRPPQLDHDHQPAPRHLARELPRMGHRPGHRDPRQRRAESAPARRAADPVAPAPQQRNPVPDPLLPGLPRRPWPGCPSGAPACTGCCRPCRRSSSNTRASPATCPPPWNG
jgi:hypothetical protein